MWEMSRLRSNMGNDPNDGTDPVFVAYLHTLFLCRVFPDYFYTFSLWESDQTTKLIDFVMIDTVLLCGGGNMSDWDHRPLEGPENSLVAETYWQWIEEQLRQSTYVVDGGYDVLHRLSFTLFSAPYLIVGGHFPIYSISEHGPTECLVKRLRPLLHQYKATTYLCGHDHNLQVQCSLIVLHRLRTRLLFLSI